MRWHASYAKLHATIWDREVSHNERTGSGACAVASGNVCNPRMIRTGENAKQPTETTIMYGREQIVSASSSSQKGNGDQCERWGIGRKGAIQDDIVRYGNNYRPGQ